MNLLHFAISRQFPHMMDFMIFNYPAFELGKLLANVESQLPPLPDATLKEGGADPPPLPENLTKEIAKGAVMDDGAEVKPMYEGDAPSSPRGNETTYDPKTDAEEPSDDHVHRVYASLMEYGALHFADGPDDAEFTRSFKKLRKDIYTAGSTGVSDVSSVSLGDTVGTSTSGKPDTEGDSPSKASLKDKTFGEYGDGQLGGSKIFGGSGKHSFGATHTSKSSGGRSGISGVSTPATGHESLEGDERVPYEDDHDVDYTPD
eukprot:gene22793-9214_t